MNKKTEEMRDEVKQRKQKYSQHGLGPIKFEFDEGLKRLSMDWAEKVINNIESAIHNPEKVASLDTDTKYIYEELKAWSWFDKMPIDVNDETPEQGIDNAEFYIHMIAMDKYRKLKWDKDHPPKLRPSKWEIVTGTKKK
jgi:hypothetical protein